MAIASELNQIYLAYFGRPADAGALAFYANASLADVAVAFGASPESQALYGTSGFGAAQLTQVYTALFNRPAEPAAIAAWSALLAGGQLNPATLAFDILNAAQNDDRATVGNKLAFTAQWTSTYAAQAQQAGASSADATALAKSLLAGVGSSPASLSTTLAAAPAAITKLVAPPAAPAPAPAPAPQTFTLTTAADTFTGDSANETFAGTLGTGATFQSTDLLDGAAGDDTLDLSVQGSATLNTTNVTHIENLVLRSTGSTTNAVQVGNDGGPTGLHTLTLFGSTALTVMFADDNVRGTLTAIDASQTSAGVTIGSSDASGNLGVADQAVTLGGGDDMVYFGANLTGADTVDGGAGYNVLAVSAAVTNASLAGVSHVEAIRFYGAVEQDASLTGLAGLRLQAVGSNTVKFTNLAGASTIDVPGALTKLTLVLADGSGPSDSLTVRLGGTGITNAEITTLDATTGLETLNLNLLGDAASTSTIRSDLSQAAHVATGAGKLVIEGRLATSAFDASAMTGAVELSGPTSGASIIKTGSGNDLVKLGTGADAIDTGAGDDVIWTNANVFNATPANAATGGDQITTGLGNDTVVFSGNIATGAAAATNYNAYTHVLDFTPGADKLGFSAANQVFGVLRSGSSSNTPGLSKQGSSAFGSLNTGDTMVVQELAKDAGSMAATASASFFKLSTAVAFSTDIQTTFSNALGTTVVTGLTAYTNFVLTLYDTTHQTMVIGLVDTGWPNDGDNRIDATDLPGVAIIGTVDMTQAQYVAFNAANLTTAS